MTRYRNHLPQLAGDLYLTDGGLETTLYFNHGIDLPHVVIIGCRAQRVTQSVTRGRSTT